MSEKRRNVTLIILVFVFFIFGPILILSASGYSIMDIGSIIKLNLHKTGGIYISNIGNNSEVFLDGKVAGNSSFLERSILLQRLSPKVHIIEVEKDGFLGWSKEVSVYPNRVTEVRPVLVPENITAKKITDKNLIATISKILLKKIESTISTSTGVIIFEDNHTVLSIINKGNIKIEWLSADDTPQYMCLSGVCDPSMSITLAEKVTDLEWHPENSNGIISITSKGIYIVELDPRGSRIINKIISPSDLKLSSFDKAKLFEYKGDIYLKTADSFYEIIFSNEANDDAE